MSKIRLFPALLIAILFSGCKQQESTHLSRKNIVEAVFASGSIIAENQYVVTSLAEGYLVKSYVNDGDSVKAGQILFRINSEAQPEQLMNAEANYRYAVSNIGDNSAVMEPLIAQRNQVKSKLETDSLNFLRYQRLVRSGAVSQVDYEKAKITYEDSRQDLISINSQISDTRKKLQLEVSKSKANLATQQNSSSYYEIRADVGGVIFQIQKKEGELVRRGESVAEIGSGQYIAKLFIVEEDVNRLEPGQRVYVELNTEKNKTHNASLSKVYPYFDNREQSFIAEAVFEDYIGNLKSGTQLQANIKTNEKTDALVIPAQYLLPKDFVLSKSGKVKVTVGIRTSEWVEILSGVGDSTAILLPK